MNVAHGIPGRSAWAVILALTLLQSGAGAYEVETHSNISREAYRLAKINDFLAEQLGVSPGRQLARGILPFQERGTAERWLREGSIDEDNQLRFFNHFYDPIHNRGLDATGRLLPLGTPVPLRGERSHEWGLENPREINGQDFSYRDAREYFRLSLTEPDPRERERRLADTFYALGHVIHLIQDLASPPHTRNGPHGGQILLFDAGPRSVVERYLDTIRDDLKFDGYPIPKAGFAKPRDFWVETDASGAPLNGPDARGLSQIINRNFVSEGTNFTAFVDGNHHPEYPDPILKKADCYEELVETQDADGRLIRGLVQFCRNSFRDPNTGVLERNPRMTTFSLCGRDLQELGFFVPQGFSLNALNAVSIGELTIPRAVGYSAGLLDYFFRGTLDFTISASAMSPGQTLNITNKSDETMEGTFILYADNFSDTRSAVAGASFSLNLGPGATSGALNFTPPPEVAAYVLVFQGRLGNEDGAVAARVNEWYAVTDVTPGTITPGQGTTVKITVKSNFSREPRALVAALFDGRAGKLASTSVLIPTNGLTATQIALDITSTTISTDPGITPRPISLVVATAGDIGSMTVADLSNQTPVSPVNLVRVGEASRLPIYQHPLTSGRMFVSSSTGGAISFVKQFDTRPFTVTWKFKNAAVIDVFVQPLTADGDFLDGKTGELHFSGTQPEFSTFTISFAELGERSNAMSFLAIDASLSDGFVCILDVVRDGESQLLSGNNHGGFSFRECPE